MAILFSDLCLLFERIAQASKSSNKGKRKQSDEESPIEILSSWIGALIQPSAKDGLVIYRLIFPEHDIRRRYGLKETLLARELPSALGFRAPPDLLAWDGSHPIPGTSFHSSSTTKHGCFGLCLEEALSQRTESNPSTLLDIHKLNSLLDELASHCEYSSYDVKQNFQRRPRRLRQAILFDLFSPLSPSEASHLAQIILRDLSPLLYPLPSVRYDVALLEHNSANVKRLEFSNALRAWHWALPSIYKFRADLDAAFETIESNAISAKDLYSPTERQVILKKLACPAIGRRVEIPSASKGRSCSSVASTCLEAGLSFAEIKYDGERMQIHVDLDATPCITIFSKSKRDSTLDRLATHSIILAALGLPFSLSISQPSQHLLQRASSAAAFASGARKSPPRKVILEAEMVAYNEDIDEIDEFSNLPLCVTHNNVPNPTGPLDSSQTRSNGSGEGTPPHRHLAVVFFDLLLLDSESLVFEPYSTRRTALEAIIRPIQGYVQVAQRSRLDYRQMQREEARNHLIRTFAKCIVNRNEGLMIKTADSLYNDSRPSHKWIKLKRDYIPGLGDTMSCCIVAASWCKERGRELRVPTSCFTTFWIGALENEIHLQNGTEHRPRYRVLFSVSHLPNRPSLLRVNELVGLTGGVSRQAWRGRVAESWVYDLIIPPSIASQVSHILAKPLVFELFGAGFARPRGSPYYELRFPRVSAIHESRQASEAVTLAELQKLAKEAVSWFGSEAESEVDDLWSRHSITSGEDSVQEPSDWRTRQEEHWVRKLSRADKPKRKPTSTRKGAPHDLSLQQQASHIYLPPSDEHAFKNTSSQIIAGLEPATTIKLPLAHAQFIWTALPTSLAADIQMATACRVTSLHSLLFASARARTNHISMPCVIFAREPVSESVKQTLADMLEKEGHRREDRVGRFWLFTFSDIKDVPLHANKLEDLPSQHLFAIQ